MSDQEGRTFFIKSAEKRLVGCVVWENSKPDVVGDWADAEGIWSGIESWMLAGHPLAKMHQDRLGDDAAQLVECFQCETKTRKGGTWLEPGDWYICCKVHSDELWESITAAAGAEGGLSGVSMGGKCMIEPTGE